MFKQNIRPLLNRETGFSLLFMILLSKYLFLYHSIDWITLVFNLQFQFSWFLRNQGVRHGVGTENGVDFGISV